MSLERLQAHYGFTRMPFRRDLAPGALHRSAGHAEAVARIGWCVAERALGVLTGEVGAGKTVAVRAALAALDPSRHTIIYLGNPEVGARGLYATIVTALGGTPRFHKAALIPQTAAALAAEDHERGRQVVLDEAHLLDPDQLEELRLLTNAEMDAASPFACLLVGQPTLPRSTSASRCVTRWPACNRKRPRATSPTTSRSPAAPTRCSATTRSP
jgi:type II secretory pathway predicted ATPase ExeA